MIRLPRTVQNRINLESLEIAFVLKQEVIIFVFKVKKELKLTKYFQNIYQETPTFSDLVFYTPSCKM